jgi:hypothetical protein
MLKVLSSRWMGKRLPDIIRQPKNGPKWHWGKGQRQACDFVVGREGKNNATKA